LLDLYINDRSSTVVGPDFPVEAFLAIRIPLNKEAEDNKLPRFTDWRNSKHANLDQKQANMPNGKQHGGNKQQHPHGPNKGKAKDAAAADFPLANPLTPISANGERLGSSDRARDGTVRFMLDPERADAEKRAVSSYFKDEMHEVAEE
jgi:CTD kinase subunit beta